MECKRKWLFLCDRLCEPRRPRLSRTSRLCGVMAPASSKSWRNQGRWLALHNIRRCRASLQLDAETSESVKLSANALRRTGASRHGVIGLHQVNEKTFRTFAAKTFLFCRCLSVSRSSRLAADSSGARGKHHLSGSRLGRRMSGRIVVSVASRRRRPCLGRNATTYAVPHERRKAQWSPRATSRSAVSGMLIARDQKTIFNNCGPRSCQPRSSFQMSRFVQVEKRAPAPLIGAPSLKCSQSRVMPQMPFSSRPFLGPFGRRIRWGGRITRSD